MRPCVGTERNFVMVKSLAPIALGFALVLASGSALAQPPAGTVRISDLDLATPAGVAKLDRRIGRAVAQLCGTAFPTDLNGRAQVESCRAETMKSVADQRTMLLARRGGAGVIALKGR
jgi:UrcA family protein